MKQNTKKYIILIIFTQSYNYIYNHNKIKSSFEDIQLNNKDINDKNIYSKFEVTFIRKKKNYTKPFYVIMNDVMENNIKKKTIFNILVIVLIMQLLIFLKEVNYGYY